MIILEFLAFLIIFPIAAYLIILGITCIIDFVGSFMRRRRDSKQQIYGMLIDVDALAEWLAKNYEPPFKLCEEEIGNLRWPIDYNQQKEIWLRRLAEFSQTIGTKKD